MARGALADSGHLANAARTFPGRRGRARPFAACPPVFITAVLLLSAACPTAAQQGVLEPENANEARLNRLQSPDRTMDAIGIRPGMAVAEIGAGAGRWVVQLAVRVGDRGRIFAEDIDAAALDHLTSRCARWGLKNVETIVGDTNDPKLPAGQLDRIFVISSYHHFDDPVALLGKARAALKPDGKLAIGEWFPSQSAGTSGTPPERLKAQMASAGYVFERMETSLQDNGMYLYIFSLGPKGSSMAGLAPVRPRMVY